MYKGKNYELTPGKLFIIDCMDYQEYYSDKTELWNFKFLHFNGATSREYYKKIFNSSGPVISIDNCSKIIKYINKIIYLMKSLPDNFEIKSSSLIMLILTEILLTGSSNNNESPTSNIHIGQIISYIQKNHVDNISVDDMASIPKLSKFHFIREFKKATGFAPYEYLTKYRITHAKYLLENTCLSISEIAYKTGFNNPGNFIRKFKELENLTPGKFRNNKFV